MWDRAIWLAPCSRRAGVTVPATDLLIAAAAEVHGVPIEHREERFDLVWGFSGPEV